MSNLISRIAVLPPEHSAPQGATSSAQGEAKSIQGPQDGFQKFVIQSPLDGQRLAPVISPAQHQAARRRLFDKLVRHVLNEKNHPFSGLDSGLKQDMINSITEELVRSHYKV